MNNTLRTCALLVLLAACGDDDDGGGAGGSLAQLEKEHDAKVAAVCERANECYQPDVEPDDEDWCYIPTLIEDTSESGVSFAPIESDISADCIDEIRTMHAADYRKVLECGIKVLDVAQEGLEGDCPDMVSALDEDHPCEAELEAVYGRLEDALDACEGK